MWRTLCEVYGVGGCGRLIEVVDKEAELPTFAGKFSTVLWSGRCPFSCQLVTDIVD